MMRRIFTLFLILAIAGELAAVELRPGERDLKSKWLVQGEEGNLVDYRSAGRSPEVIYVQIDARELSGQKFSIRSAREFTLFVNNKVAGEGDDLSLDVDSLAKVYATHNLLVAVRQAEGRYSDLLTTLSAKTVVTDGLIKRSGMEFRDFGIVGLIVLMAFGVVVVRLNPKLTSDYFSVPSVFSMRDGQDGQSYTRIGSSTNILYYLYCSMLVAYYVLIIFNFTRGEFPLASSFFADSFWSVALQWLKLSLIILGLFFAKIALVFGMSWLFGMPSIGGIHFFNWVRALLIVIGILTMILFLYFTWHGQSVAMYSTMLKLLGWIIGGWIILIFLKLSAIAGASMFHLFSYICATELIPFLLLIKVLYK